MEPYDPRYLAGVLLFNAHDYFEAHEVWEDLWAASHGTERRFYQGLIQAAVGLCHFSNGNLGGAAKLYRSSRDYMEACGFIAALRSGVAPETLRRPLHRVAASIVRPAPESRSGAATSPTPRSMRRSSAASPKGCAAMR